MWENSDTSSFSYDLSVSNSDTSSFSYDLSVSNSDTSLFHYFLTDLEVVTLEYLENLPEELFLYQFNSNTLKSYVSFYNGVYIVDDNNIDVTITDIDENTKKVYFLVAYEEDLNSYYGYFEKEIKIKEVTNKMADFNNLGLAIVKYKKSGAASFVQLGKKKEGTPLEAAYEEMFEPVLTLEGGETPHEEVISGQKFGFNITVIDYTMDNLKDLTQVVDGTAGYEVGNNIGSLTPNYEVIIHFVNKGIDVTEDIYIPKCSLRIVNNISDTVNAPSELVIEAKAHWKDNGDGTETLYKIGQNPA